MVQPWWQGTAFTQIGTEPMDCKFNDVTLGSSLMHLFVDDTRCHNELPCSPDNSPLTTFNRYSHHLKGGSP
ncbi:hypothetical protein EE612_058524 [Oryza sativa]|nr:hypothetical protein EE612_058524 [Oryza sativa]